MSAWNDAIAPRRTGDSGAGQEPGYVQVLRDPARVAALLDPERRRVLGALRDGPDSASGLARRLGETRQRLNYHLRVLQQAALVELHEERQRRGFVERVMRPTALHFLVDPGAADEGATDRLADPAFEGDRFSATHLMALAARVVREVALLREKAQDEEKRLATAGLTAEVRLGSPAEFQEFVRELSRAVAGVVARFDRTGPDVRPFRVVGGSYPAPSPEGVAENPDPKEGPSASVGNPDQKEKSDGRREGGSSRRVRRDGG